MDEVLIGLNGLNKIYIQIKIAEAIMECLFWMLLLPQTLSLNEFNMNFFQKLEGVSVRTMTYSGVNITMINYSFPKKRKNPS